MMISSNPASALTTARKFTARETAQSEAPAGDQVQLGGGDEVAPGVYRQAIPGSFIVKADASEIAGLQSSGVEVEKVLGKAGESTYLLIQAPEGNVASLEESFSDVMPNYQYSGNVYDDAIAS